MIFEQFVEKLNKDNPYYEDMLLEFRPDQRLDFVRLARKGADLPTVVHAFIESDHCPIVDKKLGIVFGCKSHGLPRQDLYRYHYFERHKQHPGIDSYQCEDLYISEGHGWFISSMNKTTIIAASTYRQDRFDKLVFPSYSILSFE